MNMKKYAVLVLAAVLASAVSAGVSQYKISYNTVSRDEISYKKCQSAWRFTMSRVKYFVRSDHPSAEEMLRDAIRSEADNWKYYMFAAERALSSADDSLRAKILERLEKDRNARPQICIDMEKTCLDISDIPVSSLQQAKQQAKLQLEKQEKQTAKRQTKQQEKQTAKRQTTKISSSATARPE